MSSAAFDVSHDLPAGVLTFLFTDIVDSTSQKPRMAGNTTADRDAAYRELVKRPHDELIMRRVAEGGGHEVNPTGDGFAFVFSDPERAVLCAVRILEDIRASPIQTPLGPLFIRAGLHTGIANPCGSDYVATNIDYAQRVSGSAKGGEVLISKKTHALVEDQIRNVRCSSAGWFDLKGFEHLGPQELFLVAPTDADDAARLVTPQRIAEQMIAEIKLTGTVKVMTSELLSQPAQASDCQSYHRFSKELNWRLIAAGADIERCQMSDLLTRLRDPREGFRIVCVTGRFTCGKSTLAWRSVVKLYEEGALVLQVNADEPDVWLKLFPALARRLQRHFFILVDDLFDLRQCLDAIAVRCQHDDLQATVVATSRSEDIPNYPVVKLEQVPVEKPTPEECDLLRVKLAAIFGESPPRPSQSTPPDSITDAVEVMVPGASLAAEVHELLERLETTDESAYRAMEYLAFCHQFRVAIPKAVLLSLDTAGRFYGLATREITREFVNEKDGSLSLDLQPVRAGIMAAYYAERRNPANVLAELAAAVDAHVEPDRLMLGALVQNSLRATPPVLLLAQVHEKTERCVSNATTIREISFWSLYFYRAGNKARSETVAERAFSTVPTNALDCCRLSTLYRRLNREPEAVGPIGAWIKAAAEPGPALREYLRLTEKHCASKLPQLIDELSSWLSSHPDHADARPIFIRIVMDIGSDRQRLEVVEMTAKWLGEHPSETNVWHQFLKLLFGMRLAEEYRGWTGKAIRVLPQDPLVLIHAFKAFPDNADCQFVESIYRRLREIPGNHLAEIEWAQWLVARKKLGKAEEVLRGLLPECESMPDRNQVQRIYCEIGKVLLYKDRAREAMGFFDRALEIWQHNPFALLGRAVASWQSRPPDYVGAIEFFRCAVKEAHRTGKNRDRAHTNRGFFRLNGRRWREAKDDFTKARGIDWKYVGNDLGIGIAETFMGDEEAARSAFKTALEKEPREEKWKEPRFWNSVARSMLNEARRLPIAIVHQTLRELILECIKRLPAAEEPPPPLRRFQKHRGRR
jgi:class 3 adenylate cyclase/tetratricopeptide (TPR) repeat protein